MTKTFKIILFSLLIITNISFAQTNSEIAWSKAKEAVKLMDKGQYEDSRKLLLEAQKLDPEEYTFSYEFAYSYYLAKNYESAIKEFEKTNKYNKVSAALYQTWGNAYDIIDNPKKAFEIYDLGLKLNPKAGVLYLEKGNVYNDRVSGEKAIPHFEKGIEVDPTFSSNYYRAALYYLKSTEQIWGMIYGEIFMNLESNTGRTVEISKLLFDTYKSQIKITGWGKSQVDFCTKMIMYADQPNQFPFCMTYASTLLLAIPPETTTIDLSSLNTIRQKFIEEYFFMKRNEIHPNVLFDYLKKVSEAGHLEAYNYWLLQKGDTIEFDKWKVTHGDNWTKFGKWSNDNYLILDETHKFYQNQY
ncbi:tetratricopeptide repeat protein [Flavobacterium psychrotolerans]|uniref:Uncharacterized protein n=1 Tax=Flavobacterium psychrotolerans TaxID=2169410 RepID=A0A2U1JHN6_9FLAO|nr:tetratricopeptide repeat protein [Flavobacterium psychrotolerans]PWA04642.1 hypothetical protein DB895_10300 [Flavobacterium psychrotolerans]